MRLEHLYPNDTHQKSPPRRLCGLLLVASLFGGCGTDASETDADEPPGQDAPNPDEPGPEDPSGGPADDRNDEPNDSEPSAGSIVAAYLGITDILFPGPLSDVTGCEQAFGDEGMPVVFDTQVRADTLEPSDFRITSASGAIHTPTCATLAPADEPDELFTVLLAGPLGTDSDRPVAVEVVGELSATDGRFLGGLSISEVMYFESGVTLALGFVDLAGSLCASRGSTVEVALAFTGGVTAFANQELDDDDLAGFRILGADSAESTPLAFDDLGDGDNHVVLCVPEGVRPRRVELSPNTVFDPTNNPNPATGLDVGSR